MERDKLAIPPPWARWIGLAVEFQARPSVIPPLWRDDRCAPQSVEQADLEGYHSYKFIYSGFFTDFLNSRKLLILLVGAGRFERPTPCAQGRCATRLRYAPTFSALLILNHFPNFRYRPACPNRAKTSELGGARPPDGTRHRALAAYL